MGYRTCIDSERDRPCYTAVDSLGRFCEAPRARLSIKRPGPTFVGACPKCEGTNTGDCENDPEIDELLVGRCYDCGQLWCTECLRLLEPQAAYCECWDEEESLEEDT